MNIYRFNDKIGMNTEKGTIYLTHKELNNLKKAINKIEKDIKINPKFYNSPLNTIEIKN